MLARTDRIAGSRRGAPVETQAAAAAAARELGADVEGPRQGAAPQVRAPRVVMRSSPPTRCDESAGLPRRRVPPRYEIIDWQQPLVQPAGAFEVRQTECATDVALWAHTLANGRREVACFEAFDAEGQCVSSSGKILGGTGTIESHQWTPVWRSFLGEIGEHPRGAEVVSIRFTHTHPHTGLQVRGSTVGIGVPQFLSPGDLHCAVAMREDLDQAARRSGALSGPIWLEMVAVAYKDPTVGDAMDAPMSWEKLRIFLGFGKPIFVKPSVVLPPPR